jgi:hypothetical protein
MNNPSLARTLVAGAFLAASAASFAGPPSSGGGGSTGGVITIDQGRAEAGGVTAGDAAGFPITLSQPGSYRLMSNLVLTDPNVNAIEITADNVTLDLNGFSIATPVTCSGSGSAFNCTVAGQQGHGIYSINRSFTTVRNGQVRGFRSGVSLGLNATVERLTVQHAWSAGIVASHHSVIADNMVSSAGVGIALNSGTVRGNSVASTRDAAISATSTTLVIGNRLANVGSYAISTGSGGARDNLMTNYQFGALYGTASLGDGQTNLCNGVKC